MIKTILDYLGIGNLEQRHREWRRQQISLEIEEAQTECAQLAAWIGKLQKEKAELEQEMNRAHD